MKPTIFSEIERGKLMSADLFSSLIGSSQAMQKVKKLITQVAKTDASVLILGESGTGKEVVAHSLHEASIRAPKSFVPINCGAIPAELLESELFGHEKGAFTGAITARKGRFEMAEKGSIFLDEIGDMPLTMQVKLLRVLQERSYERVGGNKTFHCDVRVIAATHRNLEDQIADGGFREDLFYRLNVFPIEIPALRERAEDVSELLEFMFTNIRENGMNPPTISKDAMASLQAYPWPGNVRELSNLAERLSILFADETIRYADLPERYQMDIAAMKTAVVPKQNDDLVRTEANKVQDEVLKGEIPQEEIKDEVPNSSMSDSVNAGIQTEAASSPSGLESMNLDNGIDLKSYLVDMEVQLIQKALQQTAGNVSQAAKLLKTNRTTLVEKIRKYELN